MIEAIIDFTLVLRTVRFLIVMLLQWSLCEVTVQRHSTGVLIQQLLSVMAVRTDRLMFI